MRVGPQLEEVMVAHREMPSAEIRQRVIDDYHAALGDLDVVIGSSVYLTNLTGHPEISVPSGFYTEGLPCTLRLNGKLFGEGEMLKVAHAFQSKTDHHRRHPAMA